MSASILVLLVDDEVELLEGWRLLLEDRGFRVATATNGLDGLAAARHLAPDIIVTDLQMPGMHGLALCRIAKADAILRSIPIILCTASIVAAEEPQFDRLLQKPVFFEQLVKEILLLLQNE